MYVLSTHPSFLVSVRFIPVAQPCQDGRTSEVSSLDVRTCDVDAVGNPFVRVCLVNPWNSEPPCNDVAPMGAVQLGMGTQVSARENGANLPSQGRHGRMFTPCPLSLPGQARFGARRVISPKRDGPARDGHAGGDVTVEETSFSEKTRGINGQRSRPAGDD
ncbi:hypothetical protein N658DRAFT_255379 [Parathielavia hyrcaniae]|uniref:Uncharacterized protein n=1 Tax=Parathielavia hyrcaniae TaxID=113614 RepID=A0AAN6SYU2_9PEZI|nr:hypothetical protein N658DRAFT_255379 [Parathielavia hyrcaniae]